MENSNSIAWSRKVDLKNEAKKRIEALERKIEAIT